MRKLILMVELVPSFLNHIDELLLRLLINFILPLP